MHASEAGATEAESDMHFPFPVFRFPVFKRAHFPFCFCDKGRRSYIRDL